MSPLRTLMMNEFILLAVENRRVRFHRLFRIGNNGERLVLNANESQCLLRDSSGSCCNQRDTITKIANPILGQYLLVLQDDPEDFAAGNILRREDSFDTGSIAAADTSMARMSAWDASSEAPFPTTGVRTE